MTQTTTTRRTTVVTETPDERRWQNRDWVKALIAGGLALALLRPGAQAPVATQATAAPVPASTTLPVASVAPAVTAAPAPTVGATVVAAPVAEVPLVLTTREVVLPGPYTIQGSGTPGSVVEVLLNGAAIGTAEVGADGRWSLDTTVDSGPNEILARAVDDSGAVLAEGDAVMIGVEEPAAAAAPAVDALAADVTAGPNTISGTGAPGSTVRVLVNGAEVGTAEVGADGTWSIDDVELPSGDVSIVAEAAGDGGQAGAASEPVTATLGEAASAAPIGGPPAISAPTEGATVEPGELVVSGTGEPGATLEVLNSDLVLGEATVAEDGTWSLPVTVEAGTASIGVRPAGSDAIVGVPVRVTVGDAAAIETCTAIAVGCQAWVTRAGDLRLRIRSSGQILPDNILETLPIGTQMEVLEGPAPADDFTWWRVRTVGGVEGWVAGENLVLQPD
jgi:hypothetical protein